MLVWLPPSRMRQTRLQSVCASLKQHSLAFHRTKLFAKHNSSIIKRRFWTAISEKTVTKPKSASASCGKPADARKGYKRDAQQNRVYTLARALHNPRDNHAIVDRLLRCSRADNNSHRLSSRGGNETRLFVWIDAYCVTKFTRAPLASWASTCCDSRPASPHCLGSWRSDCKRPPPSTISRLFSVLNAEFHPL